MSLNNKSIAVIIPCYKVKKHILSVIQDIPAFVDYIFVVDDCCPENTGKYVSENTQNSKVVVIHNPFNMGVGGAVTTGYKESIKRNIDISVKVDGDGQMDPLLIEDLIQPLILGEADYSKGSRFHDPAHLVQMPTLRLIGNAALSLINKIVTGYWDIMDPTNGFTAISLRALEEIQFDKISQRYFFESDMLFRLSVGRGKVVDFPMEAKYGDEVSNLSISKVLFSFPPKYLKRFFKRVFYQYFLRDFNFGSISLCAGTFLFTTGVIFGAVKFIEYGIIKFKPAPTGMVVIPSMLIILGTQFLISFLQFDINSAPKKPLKNKRIGK